MGMVETTEDQARPDRAAIATAAATWLVVGFGIAVRLRGYLAARSLRRDEAHLTLNVLERSSAGLLRPLDNDQGAPVGFLLIQKAIVNIFGASELALRALPALASMVGLVLFAIVARRLAGPRAALVGLAVMACSEPLIEYGAQVKQYSTDVAVCLLILAASTGRRGGVGVLGRPVALALIGALATWVSHPSLFVLGGVGLAAWIALPERTGEHRREATITGLVLACWGSGFLANHFLFLRGLARNDRLIRFWDGHFAPFPPRSIADLRWYLEELPGLFADPVGLEFSGLGLALAILGMIVLCRENRSAVAMIAGPIVLVLAASSLRTYPFSGRLILFAVPLAALLIGSGFGFVEGSGGLDRRTIAAVLAGVVLLHPALGAVRDLARPIQGEELAPILRAVERRREAGDALYVYFASRPAFLYYRRYADPPILPDASPTFGSDTLHHQAVLDEDAERLAWHPRAWVVFSHVIQGDEAYMLERLDRIGRRLDEVRGFGASAYLYELGFGQGPGVPLAMDAHVN